MAPSSHPLRALLGLIIGALLTASCAPSPGAPVTVPSDWGATFAPTLRDVAYGDHERNVLDVYQPREGLVNGAPRGTIVWIHGGWFLSGDKTDLTNGFYGVVLRQLHRGYSIVSVNYRRQVDAPFPAGRDDIVTALNYVREHADELGLDVSELVVAGHSAGAAMALMVGDSAGRQTAAGVVPPVDKIVALAPITSFDGTGRLAAMPLEFWVPTGERSLQQPISLVSPSNPPTYVAHGDYDIVVPVGHSDQFAWASHVAKAPIAYDRVMSGPSLCRGHFVMCGVNTTALDAFLG